MEIVPEFDMGPMEFDSGGFESSPESFDSGSFEAPAFDTPSAEINALPNDSFESDALSPIESAPELDQTEFAYPSETSPSGIIENDPTFEPNSIAKDTFFEPEPVSPADDLPVYTENDSPALVENPPLDELPSPNDANDIYEELPAVDIISEPEIPVEESVPTPEVNSEPDLYEELQPEEGLQDPDIDLDLPALNPDELPIVDEPSPLPIYETELPTPEPALDDPDLDEPLAPDDSRPGLVDPINDDFRTPDIREPDYGEPGVDDPRTPDNPEPGWREPEPDYPNFENDNGPGEVSIPENYSAVDDGQAEAEQFDGPERPENQKSPEIITENEPGGPKRPSWDTDPDQAEDISLPSIDDEPDWNDPEISPMLTPDSDNNFDDQSQSTTEPDFAYDPTRDGDGSDDAPQNQAPIDEGPSGQESSSEFTNGDSEIPVPDDVPPARQDTSDESETLIPVSDQPSDQTSNVNDGDAGAFSISDWAGYPPDGPKPEGPFRLLDGDEYEEARNEANKANHQLHLDHPEWEDLQIHEIQPVKFGGSPTDPDNKIALTPAEHAKYTTYWNNVQRYTEKYQ